MSALSLTGLEKVAVLLKNLPTQVVEKVMRHLDPHHARVVSSALAKLRDQGDLNHTLPGVLEEAVRMLGDPMRPQAPATNAASGKPSPVQEPAPTVDIRLD